MSGNEDIAATLDAAADYLEQHGWCRGTLKDDSGRVCLVGSLLAVTGHWNETDKHFVIKGNGDARFRIAKAELCDYLGFMPHEDEFENGDILVEFNDKPERTSEDVVTTLRKAATRVREEV